MANNNGAAANNSVLSPEQLSVASTNNTDAVQSSSVVLNNSTTTVSTAAAAAVANNSHQISASDILWWREGLNLDKANLALVGFSKGCVVLNQVSSSLFYSIVITFLFDLVSFGSENLLFCPNVLLLICSFVVL